MSEIMNEKNSAVVLTDGQDVKLIRCDPGTDTFDVAREAINCEWIEIVEPESLEKDNLVLLIDEEGKLKGNGFINCIASQLYGSDRHGDVIVGNAVIVHSSGDSLELLTDTDAVKIANNMMASRDKAIDKMAKAFRLRPLPKRQSEKWDAQTKNETVNHARRQPCKGIETER